MPSKISKMLAYKNMLDDEPQDFRVRQAATPALLMKAKRLHTKVYLEKGYVFPHHLEGGIIGVTEDPYQEHSHYFVTERRAANGRWKVVASARLIHMNESLGHKSFQTLIHQNIHLEHSQTLQAHDPKLIFEVSSLVKQTGESTVAVLMLYRSMWQFSLVNGYKFWLMSVDTKLFERLRFMFSETLTPIGDKSHFKGHDVIPALLDVPSSLATLRKQAITLNPAKRAMRFAIVKFFLRGLPEGEPSDWDLTARRNKFYLLDA